MIKLVACIVGLGSLVLFLLFQAQGIYGGDSGDLVTAAYQFGIPHPPGYPLYTFLGFLLTHVPILSVSWRVGLLSSIPHAITIGLVSLLTYHITKRILPGLFASLTMLGNYVVFLYSTTPEVFALFDLFVILIIFLLYRWSKTKRSIYLLWALVVFGLSLSHHHVMLFAIPAFGYWIWAHKRLIKTTGIFLFQMFFSFGSGLLPYVYIPFAARGNSIVNWNHPVDLAGFIQLVTRAYYGTFFSGSGFGESLVQRLLQIQALGKFMFIDLTPVGILLALSGFLWVWKHERRLFFLFAVFLFFLGPIFLFYASFPLLNRFTLGTYERFLLPLYTVIYPIVGIGIYQWVLWVTSIAKRVLSPVIATVAILGFSVILFFYPVLTVFSTVNRFLGLATDETANNVGVDYLETVPAGSIVLLGSDTPLFTTQYVRYVMGLRPDVILLHRDRLTQPEYKYVVSAVFPKLHLPRVSEATSLTDFLNANTNEYEIFSNTIVRPPDGYGWILYGLLYKLVPQNEIVSTDEISSINGELWKKYHDPTKGILLRSQHLMLSDILNVYTTGRLSFGKELIKFDKMKEAKVQFEQAIYMKGDYFLPDAYMYLGLTQMFLKECTGAIESFKKARALEVFARNEIVYYQAVTYGDCIGDKGTSDKLLEEFNRQKIGEQTPLENF